jgi:hypothetical protein
MCSGCGGGTLGMSLPSPQQQLNDSLTNLQPVFVVVIGVMVLITIVKFGGPLLVSVLRFVVESIGLSG